MRRFSHHKTRENSLITLFKALKSKSEAFSSALNRTTALVLSLLLVVSGVMFVSAQGADDSVIEIRTVNVFPGYVDGDGWSNLESVTFQNLDPLALYQEFNKINSAYPNEAYRPDLAPKKKQSDEEQSDGLDEVVDEVITVATSTEETVEVEEVVASSTEEELPESATSTEDTTLSANEDESTQDEVITEPEVVDELEIIDEEPAESTVVDDTASSTALRVIDSVFAFVVGTVSDLLPLADETETTTAQVDGAEVLDATPEVAGEATSTEEVSGEEVSTTTISEVPATASSSPEADSIDVSTASTSVAAPVHTPHASSSEEDENDEDGGVTLEPNECKSNCPTYAITLSDFGVPIFEENTELYGAQLRLSFASKRKPTRDQIQSLSIRSSLDNGATWQDAGVIVIDDEASNSLNGGYYLFSLPTIDDPTLLDQLSVQIVYDEDLTELAELFVESAWLELFVADLPDAADLIQAEFLADDNYFEGMLSGDSLELPTGEMLTFDNADENTGETLIIKSDERDYIGLTKTVTYFNVTNSSDSRDTFRLQTHFPRDVGEVVSLDVWEPNKPKQVTVPEYRPFVYHCEAGWEYSGAPVTESLEDLSKLFATPTEESGATTTDAQTVATSSDILDVEIEEESETSTSAVPDDVTDEPADAVDEEEQGASTSQDIIDSASTTASLPLVDRAMQFLRATFDRDSDPAERRITSTPTFELVASSTEIVDEVFAEEVQLSASSSASTTEATQALNTYTCRDTNVVRTCDSIDGDNTACQVDSVLVDEHEVTRYAAGWNETVVADGEMPGPGLFGRLKSLVGLGVERKYVPETFATKNHSEESYSIEPGETKYFRMEIEFPMLSAGEFWIEAIGDSEYGLLDPFWSSAWQYRLPITIDNSDGTTALSEHQVYLELDSALSDFWSNVASDGADVRFIQELQSSNLFVETGAQYENAYDEDWSGRVALTIDSANIDQPLADYPVYVNLADLGSDFWTGVQSDGRDIRVTDTDGSTELAIDLVEIDATAQTGELHFLAPDVSSVSSTTFHIYYGNSSATAYSPTDTYGRNAVWAAYDAVYHFEEDPNVGITDKTGNGFDLTTTVGTAATTSGQLGTALDTTAASVLLQDADWTWATGSNLYSSGLYFQTAVDTGALWQWGAGCSTDDCIAFMPWYNAGTQGYHRFGETGGNTYVFPRDITRWHHFTTFGRAATGSLVQIYEDNVLRDTYTQSTTGANPSRSGLQIGRYNTGTYMNIDVDELRFSQVEPSLAWVAAEHLNFSTSTDFYATSTRLAGGEATKGWYATGWLNRQKITLDATEVQGSQTDFPVYVDLATLGSDFFADVASDGGDIRMTLADGETEIPIEIVGIDTGAETGELYFKANITGGLDFYIYFNNDDASLYDRDATYGSENVWTNGYQAVYHFEEDAAGTGNLNLYQDSSPNEYHGDDETTSNDTTGQLGQGVEFGDDQNDHLSLPNEAMDGLTDFSVSWWHETTNTGQQAILTGAADSSGPGTNEFITWFSSDTNFQVYLENGAESFGLADTIVNHTGGVWNHFMITGDQDDIGNEVNFYVNGVGDTENPDPQSYTDIEVANGGLIVGQEQDNIGGNFSATQNFEGNLDELRIASVERTSEWNATMYSNQSAPENFYATSSVESLQTTEFVELDFWLQHFDNVGDEADIWVQVQEIPAGGSATIWLYYGAAGATSASDELETFTYSTSTDIYYVVDNSGANTITVQSLIDNNEVSIDGGAPVSLDQGESTDFTTFSSTSVVSVLGPISNTIVHNSNDGTEALAPISFATTTFVLPTDRNVNRTYIYSPFANTGVSTFPGASTVPDQSFTLGTGTAATATIDPADPGQGFDGDGIVVVASSSVLVTHRHTTPGDGLVIYPPTTRDLFGVDSQYIQISAVVDDPDPTITCDNGTATGLTGTTRGEKDDIAQCTTGAEGTGDAIRFSGASTPMAAIQQADSDGNESTMFWPEPEFGTRYYMVNDTAYVAVVCSPRFGTTTLEIQDSTGATIETGSCAPATASAPGKAYFNAGNDGDSVNYPAGYQVVSTDNVPFYAIFEDVTDDQDEKNLMGTVQARKFGSLDFAYLTGQQELINDAQYEQNSYLWYQNGDAQTPTTTWSLGGGEFVSEGDPIDGAGAVDDGDVLRLRMNAIARSATGTADSVSFKLQYTTAEVDQCSTATLWYDVGEVGSTTAAFSGYNNASVSDGSTLSTTTLASSTVLGTYEESNLSDFLPNDVGVDEVVEWDWSITATDVTVNTNYCFRMVRESNQEFAGGYTLYPQLETVGPPNTPTNLVFFDNERTNNFTPVLEFTTTDIAGDDINYQVQIDEDVNFGSVDIDRNSNTDFLFFENLDTPSDKAPFNSGARIRFNSPTTLTATSTYWWRVRASDPNGSATSSDWSTPFSFSTNGTTTVSEWYQTTGDQFLTDALSGVTTTATDVSLTASPGTVTGTGVDFDDATVGNAWGEVDWQSTDTSGTTTVQVQYNNNGTWTAIPNTDLPGNIPGTSTSPINILPLDTDTYNEIRLVATLEGTTVILHEWTVRWGQRVETPVQGDPFDNQKTTATLPVFDFVSSDPQGDDLEYEISISTDITFTSSSTFNSSADPGFANLTTPADTDPFNSGDTITYTAQSALTNGVTYWWRTRAKDPLGGDAWSPWAEADNFTVDTAITVSTWFQTTEEQFEQGVLDGTAASSTLDSVVVIEDVGEYGTSSLNNNDWTTINTQLTYNNMIVVASPEYDPAALSDSRTVRVRNKTASSFQIKVDDYTDSFTGTTNIDYIVMEAGTWTIDNGAAGLQVIAGTEENVTDTQTQPYVNGLGSAVSFAATPFGGVPAALATISSDNDSQWIAVHIDNGTTRTAEVTASAMGVALAKSKGSGAAHAGPEDVDYVVFDTGSGSNNGVAMQILNTGAFVDDDISNGGYNQTLSAGFGGAPGVTVVMNNAENGGDGAFALKDTSGTHNATNIFLSVIEGNDGADAHGGQEVVSVVAFDDESGIIKRNNSGSLSGTIAGEDVIFSDGTGPKFANLAFTDTTPATSDVLYQLQYAVGDGSYALIPDSQIPGNSTGTSTSPIDLTGVDINTYGTIRAYATLSCGGGSCPTLDEWQVEWSEGVDMSGRLFEYDRTTNATSGTIMAAVNGTPLGGSGTVAGDGTWTFGNVTAFAGDVITVWVDGAIEAEEAVTVFVYDGLGDISGVNLYEQHLAIDADENGTTTNALLGSYDNSVASDEDIFFDVDASGNLTVCATGVCDDANLYIGDGQYYIPSTPTTTTNAFHDLVNDGTVELDTNVFNVSGSWINNATSSTDTSTVNLTASTTAETIVSGESPLNFHHLSFGSGVGMATFTISVPLDLSGDLSVNAGLLDRGTNDISLEGSLTTGALGTWSGVATTTFDGSGSVTWDDQHASTSAQNVGNVIVDGTSKTVTLAGHVAMYDMTIGSNDTLSGGGSYTMFVAGDWTNNGTFLANTSNVEFVNDNRTYPPPIPGSSDWYFDTNFVDRVPLTIDASEVPDDITNFPVYVDLSTLGADFWNSVQSDGDDIRVTRGDGQTEVAFELVEIDAAADTGELHFLANSLSSTTDTTFYIYHNNATATAYLPTDTYGRNAVWTGYEAVYHFSDDPTTVGNSMVDATGNGHDLTVTTDALATSTGQLGSAVSLASTTTGYLADTSFLWSAGDRLTTSGWYYMTAASNESLWEWGNGSQPSDIEYRPWYSGNNGLHYFGVTSGATYAISPRTVEWHHFTTIGVTSTSETNYAYQDASQVDSVAQTVANPENTSTGFRVGRNGGGGSLNAIVDELRIAQDDRQTAWIEAEYSNQLSPTIFYATSSVETYQGPTIIDEATHRITTNGSDFYDLTFDDATTSPFFVESSVVALNDVRIATGTVTFPSTKFSIGGSLTSNGNFAHNNAEVDFTSNGTETITLNGDVFFNHLYDVTFSGNGNWTFTDTNATTTNDFIIQDGLVDFPTGQLFIGGQLRTDAGAAFNANSGLVVLNSSESESITTAGSAFHDVQFGGGSLGWYQSADWTHRIEVSVLPTELNVSFTDYPFYVDLSSLGSDFWNNVTSDGRDIRVTTANGETEVAHDLVEIDTTADTGELYFLAPLVSDTATTTYYIYVGNNSATAYANSDTYGANGVWKHYEAVYHFDENPAGGITDMTGRGHDLIAEVGTPATTTGLLGTALDTTSGNVMMSDADWTWTSGDDLVSSGLYFQTALDTGALWQFSNTCGGDNCLAFLPWYDNGGAGNRGYHRFGETSGNDYSFTRDNTIWHHFTTFGRAAEGEANEIYEDDVLRDTYNQSVTGVDPSQTGLQIGRYQGSTYMDIQIDELRFATTTQSRDWITYEYTSFNNPTSTYQTDSETFLATVRTYTLNEANTDATGDVMLENVRLVAPSDTFSIGGSAQNSGGIYDPNNATTTFNSTDLGETFDFGDVVFYNLSFNGVGGGWTVSTTTVANNLSLVTGASYIQATGTTMTVNGIFSTSFASAATDWTDSTLVLTGGDYTISGPADPGDDFATIQVSSDSDIVLWNSSISTSTILDTSSIYMPDFNGIDGQLNIYGSYDASGNEHWSYATDFDGSDLTGGSERQANVFIANGSSVALGTSTALNMVGIASASTTVRSLFGVYDLTLTNATLNAQYFDIDGAVNGLTLEDGVTVTNLTDGLFGVAIGRSGLSVDASTLNAQPSSVFTGVNFASTTGTNIYQPDWTFQMAISINSSQIDSNLTEFPTYVDLSLLGSDFWSNVQSDGRDIRMTTDGGTEIPVDLVSIDTTNQTGELHFLAPALNANTDTTFFIHAGNAGAPVVDPGDQYGANAVWKNYEAVYHFHEDPTIITTDMTGRGHDLTNTVGTAATTTGLIGDALDTTTGNVLLADIDWTWIAGDDLVSSGLYFQTALDTGALWQWGTTCATDDCIAFMPWYDATSRGYHRFGETGGNTFTFTRDNTIWHHFTTIGRATDGENNEYYEDDVQRGSYAQTGSGENPSLTGLQLGRYTTGTYMDIQVDELRFSTTTPSDAWRKAEYRNLTSTSTFMSTSTGSTDQFNVTLNGVPSTFWSFMSGTGDLYGEAFDNDDGDPGAIQWDDSNFDITISGVVYEDDGITPMSGPVCNSTTEVVTVVVDGATTYTAPCDPADGSYEVTGVTYVGEPEIVTYLNSEASDAQVNVAIFDETSGTGQSTGSTIVMTPPALADNTVLVAVIGKDDEPAITPDTGWVSAGTLGNTTGDDLYTGIWYKVVADAATESTNFPTYSFTSDNNEFYSFWMGTLYNVDTVTPIDVAGSWTKLQNTEHPVASSTVTVTNGALVIGGVYAIDEPELTPPYTWDIRLDNSIDGDANNLTVFSTVQETAGATDDAQVFNVTAGRDPHVGQFAFRPASSPTATGSVTAVAVTQTPLGAALSPYETIVQRDQEIGNGTVASGADIDVTVPSVVDDDVLVAIIGKDDDFGISPPTGWILADELGYNNNAQSYMGIWYKVVTNAGSEPATYAFTSNDDSTENYAYWIGSFSGVEESSPFDVTPSITLTLDDTTPPAVSETVVTPGAHALATWFVDNDGGINMPGGSWSTLVEDNDNGGWNLSIASQTFTSTGATGNVDISGLGAGDDTLSIQLLLRPAAVSVAESITDMDLYQGRVIVRHEDSVPLSIADMLSFTNTDDTDIPFTASTSTSPDNLTVFSNNGLFVWTNKTFEPDGEVTLVGAGNGSSTDGSLRLGDGSTYLATSTHRHTIGGSFVANTGSTLTAANSTFEFTASSTGKIISSSSTITFNEVEMTGVGGSWELATGTDIVIAAGADLEVAAGTLTGSGDITLTNGWFFGAGLVNLFGGTTLINRANTLGGVQDWSFYNLTLGDGVNAEVTTPATHGTTTVRGLLTVATAHFLDAGGSVWDLTGVGNVFDENGTFLEGTSTVRYGGDGVDVERTAYYNLTIDSVSGTTTAVAPVTGLQVFNDLIVGQLSTSTLDVNANDPLLAVGGNVLIGPFGTIEASDTSTFEAYEDWTNLGTFTANGGTVEFGNIAGNAAIRAGASPFADVDVNGVGGFTFLEHATATGVFTLAATVDNFTVDPGQTLAVGGQFLNQLGGSKTGWDGSTLHLYGGNSYEVSGKSITDIYETLTVSGDTHVRFWNSSASSSVNTLASSSVYSMNHSATSGDLYIFGDYQNSTFDDYWSYTQDFDGTAIGARQVHVYIEGGGGVHYTGGSLTVAGSSTATTTIQNQGSGTYDLHIGSGTDTDWSYFQIRDVDSNGLVFSGAPDVTDISNGDFLVEIAGGSAITVGGAVINANQARNFNAVRFATSTAINAFNVTATGTAISSWRFPNAVGNLIGEAKDVDPGGDPGYIVWDDSAAILTISGNVYSNEGSLVSSVCDDVTPNIRLSVAGLTFASSSCNSITGAYNIPNIGFSANDTITVYIDGELVQAANVTVDPISAIGDMHLYENRVIVRHEGLGALNISDMSVYDSSDDADIPFTAVTGSPDTLTLPADTKLIVWNNKEFAPGGNVTVSGGGAGMDYDGTVELYAGATYTTVAGEEHSIGGSLIAGAGATYDASTATTTFTTTGAARTIDINDDDFHNLVFNGTGSWTVSDNTLTAAGDVSIVNGALTLPSGTTTVSGSYEVTGGSFVNNSSPLVFDGTGSHAVAFGGSDAASVLFTAPGTWSMTDTNATATGAFTIASGTVSLPSGTLSVGGSFENTGGTITHNTSHLIMSTSTAASLFASSSDLFAVTFTGGGTFTMDDVNLSLLDTLTIAGSASVNFATGTLSVGGSFDATGGTFAHGSGTVLFNSTDTGETVDPGANDFYDVVFASPSGGWTISADATTTNMFALTSASDFTLGSGNQLYVGGVFQNSVGGASTTWTGSTIYLDSGTTFEISPKTIGTEQYNELIIGDNTDVSTWNSSSTILTVATTSSYYSQDDSGNDGALFIVGDYHIGATTEYWSYATDFDGVALGGSPRAVTVTIAGSASSSVSVDGGTLNIIGTNAGTTTIQSDSAFYSFLVSAGTFNASFYEFSDLDATGLEFTNMPTITSLSDGIFNLSANTTTLITLSSTTLDNNAGLMIDRTDFNSNGFDGGVNVSLDATTTNSWTFEGGAGDLYGEAFDIDGTDNCSSIRWDDSECLLIEQTHYRWRNDDGGEGALDSEWYDTDWDARKTVRIRNRDAATYTDVPVLLTVTHDSDMQADFDDLRFTDSSGTTSIPYWIERQTTSVSADVWVQVPTLATSAIEKVYMYYDNVSATTTSSSTEVFVAVDDFEDDDISEYSGETGDFQTDTTFAYGGSYGLEPIIPSDFSDDGMARFDQTVSQGHKIRYRQYVDTSGTPVDEACTMFGVQGPITDNDNYAVCLELFGTDRISLVRDVVRNDSWPSVVVLATSTVDYSSAGTGWYEVVVDWQTDNTIDVTLYSPVGTAIASTSATDSTYTSGGYGFTFWENNGGWDSFKAGPRTDTDPSVYFGAEQGRGGATWREEQDTAAGGYGIGATARLRVSIENTGLDVTSQQFRLEVAPKGGAVNCEAVSGGSYAAVPVAASCGSSDVCMTTSAHVTNGDPTTDHLDDIALDYVAGDVVANTANQTGSYDVDQDFFTEVEYAIQTTVNASDDAYCFRVTNAGAPLDSYAEIAELTLDFDPVVGTIALNEGNDIALLAGTTTEVLATTTVTDLNGFSDLTHATATFYTTSSTAACTADDNDCYIAVSTSTCSFNSCAGNSCTLECRADFAYHANPTDLDGGQFWYAFIEVEDMIGNTDFDTSPAVDVLTLRALDIDNLINYGTLGVASDSGSTTQTTIAVNEGNESIDINISGTDLTDGAASNIPVSEQIYATSSFTYSSCTICSTLGAVGSNYEVDLSKPTTTSPATTDTLYWGIAIPFGTASNPHSGVNTFTAVAD